VLALEEEEINRRFHKWTASKGESNEWREMSEEINSEL
jgi:hypothetical protein